MGILNNIFGSDQEQKTTSTWVQLQTEVQLKEIDELSQNIPVLIFKHSTRCSISMFALKRWNAAYDIPTEEVTPYMLDLLSYRTISNQIANHYGVQHQSPQVLLIKNGECIYNTSHDSIDVESIKAILKS